MAETAPRRYDTLREAFAAVYRCSPADFDRRVFWKGIHRHAWLPAHWMWWTEREYFQTDLEAIHAVGNARCEADLQRAIDDLQNQGLVERSIRRGRLMICVSSTRLIAVLHPLLPLLQPVEVEPQEAESAPTPVSGPREEMQRSAYRSASGEFARGSSQVLRNLKRLHTQVAAGRELNDALNESGLSRAQAVIALEEYAVGRPELAWLKGYLADLAELEEYRAAHRKSRQT